MRFLLVNDDGIEAPGLAALEQAMHGFGHYVVLAPDRHHSGCGHQATTHRSLLLSELAGDRYMLDGTPADCTRVGLKVTAPDVDWVIAGINEGGNLGADIYMSGTVAAVREGALLGKPGIAISHYVRRGLPLDWTQASRWSAAVIDRLMAEEQVPGTYWNVNLPHLDPGPGTLPDQVVCRADSHALPVSYRQEEGRLRYFGDYHSRERDPGTDVDVCFSGRISITKLSVR